MKFLFLQYLSFLTLQSPSLDRFKEGYLSQKEKKERKRYVMPFYTWPRIHLTDDFKYPTDSSKRIGLGSQAKVKCPRYLA